MLPMRDVRTDGRRTREDRATQPMDAGWLSFAIILLAAIVPLQCWSPMTMMTIVVNEDHDYDDGHGLQV